MFFMHIKSLTFLFLSAYVRFVFFVNVNSFRKKKKKAPLMTSFTLLLNGRTEHLTQSTLHDSHIQ